MKLFLPILGVVLAGMLDGTAEQERLVPGFQAQPGQQPQVVVVATTLTRGDVRLNLNGEIDLFPGTGWEFRISRQAVDKLRGIIGKSQEWAKVAKKENVRGFSKRLGMAGVNAIDFQSLSRVGSDEVEITIRVGQNSIPLQRFADLAAALDDLPAMEAELVRVDGLFR